MLTAPQTAVRDETLLPSSRTAPSTAAARAFNRVFRLPTVFATLLVTLLVYLTVSGGKTIHAIADPDIWWHLRDAALLVRSGHFIRADTLTFTVAGKPWINFEWLAELPYYAAYRALGDVGLYLVLIAVAAAILAGTYYLACLRSGNCKPALFAGFIALLLSSVSLGPRTLLFGWLLLVLELAILWNYERGRDSTWALPPLFLLWINTHGSWFIGFVLFVVWLACGLVQFDTAQLTARRFTSPQLRRLLAIAAASFALLFVNPYGWRLVAYPLDVAYGQKLNIDYVAEWASLDFHSARGKIVLATFLLLVVLQLIRPRRWTLQDLAFAAIGLYGAVTYVRFTFLAGILVTPLLAASLASFFKPYNEAGDPRRANALSVAVLLGALVCLFPTAHKLHAGIVESYPEKALPYIRSLVPASQIPGQRVLVSYDWAGYCEWEVPEMPQFMDSRVDIFTHLGVFADYIQVIKIHDPFATFDKYGIRTVILDKQTDDSLVYLLAHTPGWHKTYDDGLAIAFQR
ncbi:MAG TPA: hypothetical protein VFE06_15970 [Acidobacteriaceae bacterium]|nr:hypothetical protein [Acidobacteriaceae bacterium]